MRKLTKGQEKILADMPRVSITEAYGLRMAALGGTRVPISQPTYFVAAGWQWCCVQGGRQIYGRM